jgi:voltage-gated potassium channel Kch
MKKNSLKARFQYYFENTISAGPLGIIRWLGLASIISILILGALIVVFKITGAPEAEPLGFLEGMWQSLMATLDTGTMAGAAGWSFRIILFPATLVGIFIISILIGAISSGIDEKLNELKKGKSIVLESDHTLILGWSEKIYSIIGEIIESNTNRKNAVIVILAELDKVEMEDLISQKIVDFKNTKIVIRSGSPLISSEINIVNPNQARSIIVLSEDKEGSDIFVIKTVLSLTNGKNRKSESYNIVAEITDESNLEAAEVAGNGEAVYVHSTDLISRITAQTCRQSGLSVIYSSLLTFEGDEIYFSEEPTLYGKTYKEAINSFDTSSVIGICTKDEQILINPSMGTIINSGDSIIAISEDDDTIIPNGKKDIILKSNLFKAQSEQNTKSEKTLIMGWNKGAVTLVTELDQYVAPGSTITILQNNQSEVKFPELTNQSINIMVGKIMNRTVIENLHPENFDNIIILNDYAIPEQENDAQILICLLHLRKIAENFNQNFSIITEMRDIRNMEIGRVTKADDFIIGDNIASLIISQIAENSKLKSVFDILFAAEGSEIYLKPIHNYIETTHPLEMYSIVEIAAQRNETVIGYRKTSLKENVEDNFGIFINPTKSTILKFNEDDLLIVLSEN